MTNTTSPLRLILLTTTAIAISYSFMRSVETHAEDTGQAAQPTPKTMKRMDTGLQYLDEKEGEGESPKTGQTCIVHYTGWLWENKEKGKKFDSSKDRNAPFAYRQPIESHGHAGISLAVGMNRADRSEYLRARGNL